MGDESSACYALESKLADARAEATDLPLSLFKTITKDFSTDREIGRGGFGVVYRGLLGNGMVVAVKKLSFHTEERSFLAEITCLIRAKHKNIVRFLGYCADTQGKLVMHEGRYVMADVCEKLLCFEYVPNGSLNGHLADEFGGLEWHQRYKIIKGICQGLRYLHEEQKIIHLDLKPDNILLDHNLMAKISDFGLSRLFGTQQSRAVTKTNHGTLGYMAPEYVENGMIAYKADIYSLGVILLEVITGTRMPTSTETVCENWNNRLQTTLSYTLVAGYRQQVQTCVEVALNCVEVNVDKRPSIGEIIDRLNETEIDCQETEILTSTELLGINPRELQFPFKPNMPITCPVRLTNNTDHRIAFRLHPSRPERYFAEWLCGVVPSRSTYTLFVTMRQRQQPPADMDEFLIEQRSLLAEDELTDISQGKTDIEFDYFFRQAGEKGVDNVHELMLTAVSESQGETTTEILCTADFDKMVSMDVHTTEPWIITSHFNGHICIWNYHTKEMLNSFEVTREQEVLSAKFIAQKQWIVAGGGDDGRIHVYNYDSMKRVKSFKALSNQVTCLAIHPTKPYVLSASYDFEIKLWDWENGWECTRVFKEEHSSSVMHIAFNAKDTNAFASVSKDMTIKVWRIDSGRSYFTLAGHSSIVRCLDYFTCGDKQYIITGSDDRTAKIWDLQERSCVKTLKGHANRVSTVCSHPGLSILMTGSRDGTVRLWNSSTFRLEGVLNFGLRKVHALGFMKGSTRAVIGHSNGFAIMDIDDGEEHHQHE